MLDQETDETEVNERLYSPLQFIRNIFGTPIEEVLTKFGLRKHEVKYLKRGEIYGWMEGLLSYTELLDMYDQSSLVWGSGYITIMGYGGEYFNRNKVRIDKPVNIVDVYGSRRVVVFQDEFGRTAYYDRARRTLSSTPIEVESRNKEISVLGDSIRKVSTEVKPPFILLNYTRTKWIVSQVTLKSNGFAFFSKKQHEMKIVDLKLGEKDLGRHYALLYTGRSLLLPMKVDIKRHASRGVPLVAFIYLYYTPPKTFIEVVKKMS